MCSYHLTFTSIPTRYFLTEVYQPAKALYGGSIKDTGMVALWFGILS